jgi:hypothetical protein
MIKISIPVAIAIVSFTGEAYGQTACGRAIMLAGQTITQTKNSTTIVENEVRMKKMLEQECAIDLAKERDTQNFAQKRLDVRTAWKAVKPDMIACLDNKLEIDGLTVDELINKAVAPSDKALKEYRTECFASLRQQ